MNERANQLAHYLQRSGVGPDVLVGILMQRSVEMIVAVLGILKAGGAYVPLDPSYPLEHLAFMVHDSGLRMLLTQERLSEVAGEYAGETLSLNEQWDSIACESTENLASSVQPESLAYVIYTSGSTGRPKGVMIQQRSVINLATALHDTIYQTYGRALRVGLSAPLAFDASVKQVVQLLSGHTLCILPEEARADATQLLDYIKRYRLDSLDCTPSHLKLLGPDGVKSLLALAPKLVLVGGEALEETMWPQLADSRETRFFNIYGPTECTVDATVSAVRAELPASTIGRPLPNVQVYVLDQRQQPVGIGIAGEICIGGDGVGRGYLQQPALTAERFIPHPYSAEAGARLYRTGDVGRYLSNGNIEHLGRLDDQVKLRGFRIELGEIEAVLASHPAVREAAVVLREDKSGDKRLVAYVTSEETTGAVLRDYLRARVPEYMVPTAFVMLERLPLTPNGKVDRRALPSDAMSLVLGSGYVAPRTVVEEIVASIWSQLLDVERIGVADNFFELGGHSLLATQVISRVRDAFGQEVALRSLFEQPTVAGLAQTIERAQRAGVGLNAPPLVPISRNVELPLSFAQQRLWFLDQMEPGSSFYNIPAAVRLRGALNIEALERTLSEVVRRHEVLRTRFLAVDGEPAQVIEPAAPIKLEVLDLSGLAEAERTAETQRLVEEESARPSDLTTGPLLRMSLIRLGAEEHVALVTMHHIISDGWSIGVLVREVAALYGAYVRGEESPLEELPIQYADFAHWQRNWLQGEVLATQLDYWRAELADAPTVIDLPLDKPRPPVQTYRGAHHPFRLSAELSSQLKDLSRQNGSTLFMTLLAAFDLLLCRYAGQEQVLVGSPIANRNRSETEGLIGFFVNTLVLHGDVRGNPSFGELLRRVREAALSAYAHQDLPFEKLVEELQPERDMSRSPLFQVMFVLQNTPGEALELEGLSLSRVENAGETAKFELSLGLLEDGGVIVGGMEYNVDLFEAETMGRLVESYERVLQAVVEDAEQRVFEIELLSESERRQILEGWNDTAAAYPRELTLSELLEAQAARTSGAVALLFEDTALSYRELNERANQLARYLQRAGVGPEVLVGILMKRSVEMVVALLGILKAGGAYVPLDPSYPLERLAFMVQDSGMGLLLTQRELLAKVPELEAEMIAVDEEWEQIAAESVANSPVLTTPDNLAYVIYTSGSTGKPKGVQIQQRSLINFLSAMAQRPGLTGGDVLLSVTSLSFDIAGLELWLPLLNGASVVVASREEVADGRLLRARLAASGATVMQATPATWSLLLEAGWPGDQGLQVLCGGEALSAKLAQALAARSRALWNLYGPTETTIWSSLSQVDGTSRVTLGMPIANTQFYVLDGQLQPAPIGVAGELYIAGDGLARGYLQRPELTAEKFVANPFSTIPGARMYRTGDLVRYRGAGELEYLGRLDQQVKVRGFRIELGEIEAVLGSHPEITESVVLVQPDKEGEKRLVAYIVAEHEPASNELRGYLRERLPEYIVPQAFVSLAALPLTPNGKVDRRALPAVEIEVESLIGPRDMVELQLAHIWEELLDVRHVGVRDDFFSLGGHSLLAVRLMARIQANFGQHLPLAALFQGATIEKLASLLREQAHEQEAPALVNIQPKGDDLPFFCVHPVGGNVLCYHSLSNHLGFERPFYGLQARGLDEHQVPHMRIEDMAAHYIEAIRSVQPDGPYLLGGWSMGGVIAYEMAQQLEAKGQRVSLLALIDAKPMTPVEDAAPWDEIMLLTNFARELGLSVDGLNLSQDELAKVDSEELLSYVLRRAIEAGIVPEDVQFARARRLYEVFKINVQAMQRYRPKPSSQRMTLIKAGEQGSLETPDETLGWGALTSGEVEIHTVPGSHFTIVREPYVRDLAEQLADCINRATLKSFASLP